MTHVAVVMPVFNAGPWLEETLLSLELQTFRDFRVIAVDDGSTDGSLEILRRWQSSGRLEVTCIGADHRGVSATRNAGLAIVREPVTMLMDADDVWLPTKIELQVARLDAAESTPLVSCFYRIWNPSSPRRGAIVNFDWSESAIRRWATFTGWGPALASTLAFRTEALETLGVFREDLAIVEDLDFAMRVRASFPVAVVRQPLVLYRQTSIQSHRNFVVLQKNYRTLVETSPYVASVRVQPRAMVRAVAAYSTLRTLRQSQSRKAVKDAINVFVDHPWTFIRVATASIWKEGRRRLGRGLGA